MFYVRAKQCKTCIYRKDTPLDINKLEAQVKDKHMKDYFKSYRVCHDNTNSQDLCCRGFWNKHKDKFQLGQLAQRLKMVVFKL